MFHDGGMKMKVGPTNEGGTSLVCQLPLKKDVLQGTDFSTRA